MKNTDIAKGWRKVIYLKRLEEKENSLYFTLINGLHCLIRIASMILRSVNVIVLMEYAEIFDMIIGNVTELMVFDIEFVNTACFISMLP